MKNRKRYSLFPFCMNAIFSIALLAQAPPPPLGAVLPAMNGTGILRTAPVTLSFSSPMLPSSFDASSVFLYGERSGRHTGPMTYDAAGRSLTLTSSKPYIFGEQLQFVLTKSAAAEDSLHPFPGGFAYKFLVGVLQGNGSFAPQQKKLPVSSAPARIVPADFNGDGYTDIAVTLKNASAVSVYLNNKKNGFHPAAEFAAGSAPGAIAAADMNGDGRPDIVTANRASNGITILMNSASGSFIPQHFAAGKDPAALAVSDCDNDGLPDIATVGAGDSLFRIFRYDGDSLRTIQSIKLSGTPSDLLLDDLNNDGYIDAAVTIRSRNHLVLFRSDSAGTFSQYMVYGTGAQPEAVIAYDAVLGSDGYVDLATINSGANNISIVKNDMSGFFQGPEHFDIGGTEPVAICGNDFDGDGDVDLAISCRSSSSIVIFRNLGEALPEITSIPLAGVPGSVAALDVTGTYGIMDLIACNPDSGTLTLLRNGFFSPPPPELTAAESSFVFPPAALNDTAAMPLKLFSLLTPATADSIRFQSSHFSAGTVFPIILSSYDSGTVTIRYHPGGYGTHNDTMKIYSLGGIISIPLSGVSPFPALTADRNPVPFGTVKVQDTAAATLTLRNGSINGVRIDSILIKNSMFALTGVVLPAQIRHGDSLVLTIRFIPKTAGDYADTMAIAATPAFSSLAVALQGKGEPNVGVPDRTSGLPAEFRLEQNFPNPFNPGTFIRFALPSPADLRVTVHDLLGRRVAQIAEREYAAGNYSVYWNASGFSSGIYYCRMEARSSSRTFVETKKLLLVK